MDRTNLSGTKIKDYGGGVFGVDSGYEREGMAAIYLPTLPPKQGIKH